MSMCSNISKYDFYYFRLDDPACVLQQIRLALHTVHIILVGKYFVVYCRLAILIITLHKILSLSV